MTVRRLLRYYGRLKGGTTAPASMPRSTTGCARMELPGLLDRQIETLSKGMSQKVQFVAAVVSKPVAADSRRAVLRPRSGERPGAEGRGARDAPPRHHGRLQHARHGDRRADVRSHLHDLPRPQGARRHAREIQDAVRRRHRARPHAAGAAALAGMPDVEAVNDYGQLQEVRLHGRSAGVPAAARRAHRRLSLRGDAAVAAGHLRADRRGRAG